MRALLVIDVQNAIVTFKDFNEELKRIKEIIKEFKKIRNQLFLFET